MIKCESMNLDYIKYDDNGYPYNGMFPPTEDLLNGNDGYDSIGKGVFFYDYAVRDYNIDFKYMGQRYALMRWMDGVPIALLDADDNELQRFEDPMDAVHHLLTVMQSEALSLKPKWLLSFSPSAK